MDDLRHCEGSKLLHLCRFSAKVVTVVRMMNYLTASLSTRTLHYAKGAVANHWLPEPKFAESIRSCVYTWRDRLPWRGTAIDTNVLDMNKG